MKTNLLVSLLSFVFANLFGQDHYVINFQSWAELESVRVDNLTQGTSLTMDPTQALHLIIKGVSVEEPNYIMDKKLRIYPNPFEHSCNIEFLNLKQGLVTLKLFSVSGKQLQNFSSHLNIGKHKFTLSGIPAGSYLVHIQSATEISSGKLFVTGQSRGAFSLDYVEYVPLKDFSNSSSEPNVSIVSNSRARRSYVEMSFWPGDEMQFVGSASHLPDVTINISPNGDETFTFIFSNGPVADSDENFYKTIVIKNQEWMTENLKSTKYNDGSPIPNVANDDSWAALNTGAYCWYNNDGNNFKEAYGALYNWYAVNNGNLCPLGWRVPTDEDWSDLINIAVAQGYSNSNILNGAGNALKSCRQVNSPLGDDCLTSNHPRWDTDATHRGIDLFGFSGLPGGIRFIVGGFYYIGGHGNWWSSDDYGVTTTWIRVLHSFSGMVTKEPTNKGNGNSVRCMRNITDPQFPTLTSNNVSSITSNSAIGGGNVTSDGTSNVTARGIAWGTVENPTIEQNDGITNDGEGLGSFISEMTNLAPETNYFVRAYATNTVGTAYGNQVSFETEPNPVSWPEGYVHCDGIETVVVDVTNPLTGKIWMDRNLGAIQVATSSADVNSYGDLFQWGRFADGHQCKNSATTSTISSSYNPGHGNFILAFSDWLNPENPDLWSGAEGINNPCPTGYRVPTDVELEVELESWVSLDSDGAFASPLKLSMAGYRSNVNGGVYDEGINGFNWSSTANLTYGRYFFFGDDYAQLSSDKRAYGFSVRCIKEIDDD